MLKRNAQEEPAYLEPSSQSLQKTVERVYQHSGEPSRAYLEPIRDSMQKPIEGEVSHPKNVGGGVAIGAKTNQKHVENNQNPTAQTT